MKGLIPKSTFNEPRCMAVINGKTSTRNIINLIINSTNFYRADKFSIEIQLGVTNTTLTANFFSNETTILIEVFGGFPSNPNSFTSSDLTSLILGQVDDVEFNPLSNSVILTGRDLTARFIDTKTTRKFNNLSISQIVTLLANEQGLTPVVASLSTLAGVYYNIDQVQLTSQQSEWTLLTYLAQQSGFVIYVKGKELHFEPQPSASNPTYEIDCSFNYGEGVPSTNILNIKFTRNLTLAKDIIVKVRCFNPKTQKSQTITVKSTQAKKSSNITANPTSDVQQYVFVKNSLTPEQALVFAQKQMQEITQHERLVEGTLTGNFDLTKTDVIQVKGTNTGWDQVYYPANIVLHFSLMKNSFSVQIGAKNHSPNTQEILS